MTFSKGKTWALQDLRVVDVQGVCTERGGWQSRKTLTKPIFAFLAPDIFPDNDQQNLPMDD